MQKLLEKIKDISINDAVNHYMDIIENVWESKY